MRGEGEREEGKENEGGGREGACDAYVHVQ